ncbi:MAG: outer membrane beta-barrel protein [Nitrospiraceae bacterium]|nr:outer membrane beta-barrel protein [Nitrospiraceae bacterium]
MTRRILCTAVAGVLFLTNRPLSAEETKIGTRDWMYGGYADLAYILNFNFPDNHRWRSKETTPRTNEPALNMFRLYVEKEPRKESLWGMELSAQAGYDTDALVPDEIPGRERPIPGADVLRHISRANISYMAPVGTGLILTAGLMKGYINYESFYAKDNFNYTRAYLTDYNPNFILGAGGRYGFKNAGVGVYILNGFNYLSHPNDLPSYGVELDWRFTKRMTFYQNLYYGPDQRETALKFWRGFSDSTVEWRGDDVTIAASYDIGTEKASELPGNPQTFWMSGAVFTRWTIQGPWSLAFRPEFFWDRYARLTDARQLLWAVTGTVEYRRHFGYRLSVLRLEYRYDRSTGLEGGFFRGDVPPMPRLVPDQQLVLLSWILAFDH